MSPWTPTPDVREPASGLYPPRRPQLQLQFDHAAICGVIGRDAERQSFDRAQGYDIDLMVGASYEFRRAVCTGLPVFSRGEAQHVLRALLAAGWTPPTPEGGRDVDA